MAVGAVAAAARVLAGGDCPWQRVIERSPRDVAAWGELAIAQMAQGDWRQAIDSLRRAVEVEPQFVEAFGQQVRRSSSSDAWIETQRSTARFLASLRSIEANSLQLLAETYVCRADLLWQYGGDRQIQQADRDLAQAQRIAQAADFQLEIPERSIEQATPPQGIHSTTAAWFATVRPQGTYVALHPGRSLPVANSAEACAGLNCAPCLEQLQRQFAPVHLGQGTYACGDGGAGDGGAGDGGAGDGGAGDG
ncbi:MAG: tetratricopeptide repeat protein, partial [Leptolyngbyaceae cyanobacterium SM1_3_5]|nr:tetratricopeptide repeat protein [Leptolyngbyaceae cyanobacterium SM1_3_5]